MKSSIMSAFLLVVSLVAWSGTVQAAAPEGRMGVERGEHKALAKVRPSPKAGAEVKGEAPLSVFADIEKGWKNRRVDAILRHFGKGKVAIAISGFGPSGGYFSKSQSFYLFKDLFKYTITRKFEFTQYRNMRNGGRKVYAVAIRHYQRRDDGRVFKDKIYVSLQREGNRWVISEIKSVR
jgi:hypothetical protein